MYEHNTSIYNQCYEKIIFTQHQSKYSYAGYYLKNTQTFLVIDLDFNEDN